jgi:tetratricopeptide (TPR) repeat protein
MVRSPGAGLWIGRRWLVVVAFSVWLAPARPPRSDCDAAFEAKAWDRVVVACRSPGGTARERMGRARIAWKKGRETEALATAEQLLDTDVAADAAYFAGYLRANRNDDAELPAARELLEKALHGYQRARRHADAVLAADMLSHLAQFDNRFGEQLQMARLAVAEADESQDLRLSGRASAGLAEAYDWIGMSQAARENFERAERLTAPRSAQLAHTYLKHAAFLLDLGDPRDLETSLRYLDAATATCEQVTALGLARDVSSLRLAIRLDRADALSQLGRVDAADRELAAARAELAPDADADAHTKLRLVEGYVSARRGDLATAEAIFRQVDQGALHDDYRWRIPLELARSYRAKGHADKAEQAYRTAIKVAEHLRGAAAGVELRPWVLGRRELPYVELLALLIDQQRGVDALVIAESLHARAWLDVVLGNQAGGDSTAELALTAARIRQRLDVKSAPPLNGPALMATIGDREALVFLTLGSVTWRAHVSRGQVAFDELATDALATAHRFSLAPGDIAASQQAAAALLPPDLSDSGELLYVVATGPLADVPFAALRWQGHYLVDERAIARLPGLAVLRSPASTSDERAIISGERAIIIGDSRGDLPEAAREVRQLAAAMGVTASVGAAASRQVLASARGARLLHIAVHGTATPSGRALVLADGNLTAADVLDAGLDPQLVMLSGCATAASDDAESWDGFPSAFLASGSRYVVATLRSVDDVPAARVIEAYYAQPAALDPIERLAAAQRQLASSLPVAAWASFAAWGSGGCDDPRACSVPQRASSSRMDAIVRSASTVQSRPPGALPRRPGSLRNRGRGPRRIGAQP